MLTSFGRIILCHSPHEHRSKGFELRQETFKHHSFVRCCHVREDRWNSSTGDYVYYTPVPPSFSYLPMPPAALSGQPPPYIGYPPYVANPGLYTAAHQPCVVFPLSISTVVMPVAPVPNLVQPKRMEEGDKLAKKEETKDVVEGGENPTPKKKYGNHLAWEKFYDEEGRAVWIHTVTGKRTLVDPYW